MCHNNLKSKVVSPELAKRMIELRWKKETAFYWVYIDKEWRIRDESHWHNKSMSAPLFCEVWDELHYEAKGIYDLMIIKNCKNETIIYYYDERTHSRIRPTEPPFHNINPRI